MDFLYIAMEYVEYGDLSQYIRDQSARPEAREITSQLLEGITVLHERHICHRDLKPQVWNPHRIVYEYKP